MGKGSKYRKGHSKSKQDKNYDAIDWSKKPSKLSFKVNVKGAK